MKRKELTAYDKWLTRRKWRTGEIISPEKAADLYLAEHPLPPAEGAEQEKILTDFAEKMNTAMVNNDPEFEQIVNDHYFDLIEQPTAEGAEEKAQRCPVCGGNGLVANGFYNQTSGYWSTSSISPETCRTCNGTGVILPSYLHAQQIADKMVSERLREELIKYDKYIGSRGWIDNYEDWAAITSVDEYLKSREK
jgi:hypothetical protein